MSKLSRPLEGDRAGVLNDDLGTAWVDYHAGDYNSFDGTTLDSSNVYVTAVVKNVSTNGTVYVIAQEWEGSTNSTDLAHALEAGEAFSYEFWGMKQGVGIRILSLQGSLATTPVQIYATFNAESRN